MYGQPFLFMGIFRGFISLCCICSFFFMEEIVGQSVQGNPYSISNFSSAQNTALNGANASTSSPDLSTWQINPALLSTTNAKGIGLHSYFHTAEISEFNLVSNFVIDSIWTFGVGAQRTSFGKNGRYNTLGEYLGDFSAQHSQLSLGGARALSEHIYIGLAMQYLWRQVDQFHAHALSIDIGGLYRWNERSSAGVTFQQLGYELKSFSGNKYSTPLDISIFASTQLQHLPLQVFVKFQKLNQWNRLSFENPFDENTTEFIDQEIKEQGRVGALVEEIFAHLVFGGEFAFGRQKNVFLRFSYDHLKNKQLGIEGIGSIEGIGLGFGFKLKKWSFDYAWERLYYNATAHQISLQFYWQRSKPSALLPRGL